MPSLLTVLLFCLFALPALARDVTFAWDPNPPAELVTAYRVESLTPEGAWVALGTTSETTLDVIGFPDTTTHVRAIAINSVGLESLPSDELIVPPTPTAPAGLRITLTPRPQLVVTRSGRFSIETSTDLRTWHPFARGWQFLAASLPDTRRQFFRLTAP